MVTSQFAKILRVFLCSTCLFPLIATAQFAGGAGTSDNPYQISNSSHLNEIRNNLDRAYILLNDIDLTFDTSDETGLFWNDGAGWEPIGDSDNSFEGYLDGAGYKVIGLTINRTSQNDVGLIGYAEGNATLVTDLGLKDVDIKGNQYVGALIGRLNSSASVIKCYSTGDVEGNFAVGGLIGSANSSYIATSYSGVTVLNNGNGTGGFIGAGSGSTVTNCYATGSVEGSSQVGGFIGSNGTGSNVTNCYSTGNVTGSDGTGGFAGTNQGSSSGNYWNTATSEWATSAFGTGLNNANMRKEASFSGWNFTDTWDIVEDTSYPFLKDNEQDPAPGFLIKISNGSISSCGAIFTDSGGPDANYLNSEDYTLTIAPSTPGEKVRVTVSSFHIETFSDYLRIYDGVNTDAPLLSELTGSSTPAAQTATNSDGKLTFWFKSDATFTFAGWNATISCTLIPPAKPAEVTFGTATNSSVAVNWVAPNDNGSAITEYNLDQKTGADGSYTEIYSGTNLTHTATGLVAGNTYYFRINAVNSAGYSQYSNEASKAIVDVPSKPAAVTFGTTTSSSVLANWTAPASNGSAITGYTLEQKTGTGGTYAQLYSGASLSFTATSLSAGTAYYYRVKATNSIGSSVYSDETSVVTLATAPNAPGNVTATAFSGSVIRLTWEAPAANGSAVTGYKIEKRKGSSGSFEIVEETTNTSLTYDVSSLDPVTSYNFRVSAKNSVGYSSVSALAGANTLSSSPSPPRNLTVTSVSGAVIRFKWEAPVSNGGSSITGYTVVYNVQGESKTKTIEGFPSSLESAAGGKAITHYQIKVYATNTAGNSENSETVEATTNKHNQVINFENIQDKVYALGGYSLPLSAYSHSPHDKLPIAYELVSGPASLAGSTLTITGVGKITIKAKQEGNDTVNVATPVERSFTVTKSPQSIHKPFNIFKDYGSEPFEINYSATSGLPITTTVSGPVTFDGNKFTLTGVGNATVTLSQPGNDNFHPATDAQFSIFISGGQQVITFTKIGDASNNGTLSYVPEGFILNATSNSDQPITYFISDGPGGIIEGNIFKPQQEGQYTISASQAGSANWLQATPASLNVLVTRGSQQISFTQVSNKLKTDGSFTIEASSSIGSAVTAQSATGKTSIQGLTVSINQGISAGKESISLFGEETAVYTSGLATVEFCIVAPPPTISSSNVARGDLRLSSNNTVDAHQWLLDGSVVATTSPGEKISVSQLGTYTAMAVSNDGCPSSESSNGLNVTQGVINGAATSKTGVNVYPVPTDDQITVELENSHFGTIHFEIYSLDGKLKLAFERNKNAGKWSTSLSTKNLGKGLYFMTMEYDQYVETIKLIKN